MKQDHNLTVALSGGCSIPLEAVAGCFRDTLLGLNLRVVVEPPDPTTPEWEHGYDGFTMDESAVVRVGPTHALLVIEVNNSDFRSMVVDQFEAGDAYYMVYAVGSEDELKTLVAGWETQECHPQPYPKFTAYMTDSGFEVGWPMIVRIGVNQ